MAQADDVQAVEFGAALRQTRLASGREIGDIARHLRIRQNFLEAIEAGRFDDLPGPTYAIGFVRAYADYLGLDQDEVVKRYKELRGGVNTATTLLPPAPVTEGRLPTGTVLLVAVVLAAVAYGGWYYLSAKGRNPGELVTALPNRIARMIGMKPSMPSKLPPAGTNSTPEAAPPASTSAAPPAATTAAVPPPAATPASGSASSPVAAATPGAPAPQTPAAAPAAPAGTQTPAAPASASSPPAVSTAAAPTQPRTPPQTAAVPAVSPPAAPPPAPAAELPSGQVATATPGTPASRVVLHANASSWVEIRNHDDQRVFSRLMRAGETYDVPPTPGLTLTTGNAGGLTIDVDGKALPPLGKIGDVRRDLPLDPDALLKSVGKAPAP